MKKTYTQKELIHIALQVQEARSKGGKALITKYGNEHFSKLGKLSQEKKKTKTRN